MTIRNIKVDWNNAEMDAVMALMVGNTTKAEEAIREGTFRPMECLGFLAAAGSYKGVKFLVKNGATIGPYIMDELLVTALHIAADNHEPGAVEYLLSVGADIEARDEFGRTPLHVAAESGGKEVVELLLNAGADIDAQAGEGMARNTPLHFAAEGGNIDAVELLIAAGAAVDAENGFEHRTPLLLAGFKGKWNVVELLLKAGAKVDAQAKDMYGRTPPDFAREEGYDGIAAMLEAKAQELDLRDRHGVSKDALRPSKRREISL